MRAEYKRDMNHNYLILHGEQAVNTASYQVRMLVGNVIPSILKCRLQGLDGEVLFYYEITSRQSVATMFEQRKFGKEDLKLLFGGFVQVMEEMGEYLLNPGYLVLQPEYMYLDVETRQMSFCYLPGEEQEIKNQFRNLTEYVLPRLDHQDGEAVMLGYSVYRRALEDSFHLEHIKEELYQEKRMDEIGDEDFRRLFGLEYDKKSEGNGQTVDPETSERSFPEEGEYKKTRTGYSQNPDEDIKEKELFLRRNEEQRTGNRARKKDTRERRTGNRVRKKDGVERPRTSAGKGLLWKALLSCGVSAGGIFALILARMLGYLPELGMEELLAGILVCLTAGLLVSFICGKLRKPVEKEGSWRERVVVHRERWETGENGFREGEKKTGREIMFRNEWKEPEYEGGTGKKYEYGMEPAETEKKGDSGILKLQEEIKQEAGKPEPRSGENYGETIVLSSAQTGQVSLVSREPGELATIYLTGDLTVIGKLENASDAVIPMPTVSRVHAKIRRRDGEYYLTDLNSRNGTSVNGRMLKGDEEYLLRNEDQVDFAQARYVFLK